MRSLKSVMSMFFGTCVVVSLIVVTGCSGETTVTTPKAQVESKRDALQKKTQSGIPGKGEAHRGN